MKNVYAIYLRYFHVCKICFFNVKNSTNWCPIWKCDVLFALEKTDDLRLGRCLGRGQYKVKNMMDGVSVYSCIWIDVLDYQFILELPSVCSSVRCLWALLSFNALYSLCHWFSSVTIGADALTRFVNGRAGVCVRVRVLVIIELAAWYKG